MGGSSDSGDLGDPDPPYDTTWDDSAGPDPAWENPAWDGYPLPGYPLPGYPQPDYPCHGDEPASNELLAG